jgi:hypothetical protein
MLLQIEIQGASGKSMRPRFYRVYTMNGLSVFSQLITGEGRAISRSAASADAFDVFAPSVSQLPYTLDELIRRKYLSRPICTASLFAHERHEVLVPMLERKL